MAATKAGLPRLLGVIGAGQMGAGIAQLAAMNGVKVLLQDTNEAALGRGLEGIGKSLARFIKKGALTDDQAKDSLNNIVATPDLKSFKEVDFVVEAVSENEALKRSIFGSLDKITPPTTILASNTSSISITRIANATARPDKVVGMHFMNPPPIMKLVELIRGMQTSDECFLRAQVFAEAMGKTVCRSEDRPGFIVNRVLMPMINEAFYTLMEGVASAEDIDAGMKLGTNQPMGPLTLADFIGLDTCLAIMRVLHEGLGDSKYRPCPLLVQHVDAGWLGRKTGRGVYSYQ
mmetsp:Transcript_12673/g.26817  ORF Transcript_12673/g.26817 Transcript_12673/m.26817 type:complete len:290 (+) Transcript_12673:134-1003(+)